MSRADLVVAIESAIGALQSAYRGDADESDLYEASLFVLCVDAARAAGGRVLLTTDGRTPTSGFRFRRSPGNLWLGTFTYAVISFDGLAKHLEIHLGVYVAASSSRVAHECDVAVLDQQEAQRSRLAGVHPRKRGLIAAVEAKHYSASPSLGIGRSFLGLTQELGAKDRFLVFPARSSANLAGLIARKTCDAYPELLPGSPAAERLRGNLNQAIRNWKDQI